MVKRNKMKALYYFCKLFVRKRNICTPRHHVNKMKAMYYLFFLARVSEASCTVMITIHK